MVVFVVIEKEGERRAWEDKDQELRFGHIKFKLIAGNPWEHVKHFKVWIRAVVWQGRPCYGKESKMVERTKSGKSHVLKKERVLKQGLRAGKNSWISKVMEQPGKQSKREETGEQYWGRQGGGERSERKPCLIKDKVEWAGILLSVRNDLELKAKWGGEGEMSH